MILWIIVFLCTISHDKELARNIGTRCIFSSISGLSEICKQKVEKKAKNTMKFIILNWNIRFCRVKSALSLPKKIQNTWICIDVVTENSTEKRSFMKNWSRTKPKWNNPLRLFYLLARFAFPIVRHWHVLKTADSHSSRHDDSTIHGS